MNFTSPSRRCNFRATSPNSHESLQLIKLVAQSLVVFKVLSSSTIVRVAVPSKLDSRGAKCTECQMCKRLLGARSCDSYGWNEQGAVFGGEPLDLEPLSHWQAWIKEECLNIEHDFFPQQRAGGSRSRSVASGICQLGILLLAAPMLFVSSLREFNGWNDWEIQALA